MKKILFPFLLLFISFFSKAQVYTMPVTFHLRGPIGDPFWEPNTTDQALADLICDINKIFAGLDDDLIANYSSIPSNYIPLIANTQIRFYIKDIDRPTSRPTAGGGYSTVNLGGIDPNSLNIYLYDFSGGGTGSFNKPSSGYTMKDVILIHRLGFNKSGVAHEIGHALDLCHLNGSGCGINGSPMAGTSCGSSDDCCGDTPSSSVSTCTITDGINMPQNIMQDNNNGCRMFFTNNQKTIMRTAAAVYRPYPAVTAYSIPLSNSLAATPPYFFTNQEAQTVTMTFASCTDISQIASIDWVVGPCPPPSPNPAIASGSMPVASSTFNWGFLSAPPYNISSNCILYVNFRVTYTNGYYSDRLIAINNYPGSSHCFFCETQNPGSKSGTTSISSTISTNNDIIFPNPADNAINFKGHYTSYSIFELTGKLIERGNIESKTIDISSISSGTYIIKLISDIKTDQSIFIKK